MSRTIKITISDDTLNEVRKYCQITGKSISQVIRAQDWSAMINDAILQHADFRFDIEEGAGTYPNRETAAAAAATYWRHHLEKWETPLQLKFLESGEKRQALFESPLPMPEDWLKMKHGGYMFAARMGQEEINRLVDQEVL